MQKIRYWSAEQRFTATFAALLAVMFAVLMIGSSGMKSMQRAELVFEGDNRTAQDLLRLKDQLTRQRQQMLHLILASTPAEKQALESSINTRAGEIDHLLDNLIAQFQGEPELSEKIRELQAVRRAWRETRDRQVIPLIHTGRFKEAKTLLTTVQQQRFERIRALAKVLGDQAENRAQDQAAGMKRSAERSTTAFLAAIIVFALSVGALLYMLQSSARKDSHALDEQ